MSSSASNSFSISGFGSGFASRQRDLFASLDAVEKEREEKKPDLSLVRISNDDGMEVDSACRGQKRKAPMRSFRGKESIFKRPEMPPPRRARQSVPDHQRNPHKWTKYSLGDVSPQDMSERSNTVTALAFLRELQARKDRVSNMDVEEPLSKPVVFKSSRQRLENHKSTTSSLGHVSTVSSTETSEEAERPSFYRSKVVMPEYVVGLKKKSKKKLSKDLQNKDTEDSKKGVMLGHLIDEENE